MVAKSANLFCKLLLPRQDIAKTTIFKQALLSYLILYAARSYPVLLHVFNRPESRSQVVPLEL